MFTMTTKKIDVQQLVQRLARECFEAHRGAFWLEESQRLAVAFGNDGHNTDERSKQEVVAVRRFLAEFGGREIGFATDKEGGYGWALVCELPAKLNPSVLEGMIWAVWSGTSAQQVAKESVVLDWDAITKGLHTREFDGVGDCFTRVQADIARSVLEGAGLRKPDSKTRRIEMETAITRLKAAQSEGGKEDFQAGAEAATKWVREQARPQDLRRLEAHLRKPFGFLQCNLDNIRVEPAKLGVAIGLYCEIDPLRAYGGDPKAFWEREIGEGGFELMSKPDFARGFAAKTLELSLPVKTKAA